MPRPKGTPKTGGRVKGSISKKKRLRQELARVPVNGLPLEFMLNVMRGTVIPKNAPPAVKAQLIALQFDAAKAAAPYVHARISAVLNVPQANEAQNAAAKVAQLDPSTLSQLELARRVAYTLHRGAKLQKRNGTLWRRRSCRCQ
jgi:hypothetical protein